MSLNILRFDSIDSTNQYVLDHMETLEHGTVVIAKTQTKGRGRYLRKWVSPDEGNL